MPSDVKKGSYAMKIKMKTLAFCGVCFYLITSTASAVILTLSTNQMGWADQGFIDATILPDSPEKVRISILYDKNGNFVPDPSDTYLAQFEVQDGVTNALGAETILDDNDASTNGIIQISLSMYGDGLLHIIGDYFWQVEQLDPGGAVISSDYDQFFVTGPENSSIWISGEVRDASSSNLISDAVVQLLYPEVLGPAPSIWSDSNGCFCVAVPSYIASNDVLGVCLEGAEGYFVTEMDSDTGDLLSIAPLQQQLAPGTNQISNPLFLVPAIPSNEVYTISGHIYWTDGVITNPLAGVLVSATDGNDEDEDSFSFDLSKVDGSYSLTYAGNSDPWESVLIAANDSLLSMRGLFAEYLEMNLSASANGVDLYCYTADALAFGTVENQDTDMPLSGVCVNVTYGGTPVASAYTISNGFYEIALMPNRYNMDCDENTLAYLRYKNGEDSTSWHYADLRAGGRKRFDFSYKFSHLIKGHVYDIANNPIPYSTVQLARLDENGEQPADNGDDDIELQESVEGEADVLLDGHYYLLAPPNIWYVRTDTSELIFQESYFLDCYYSNSPISKLSEATPIIVNTTDVTGIDFHLNTGARFSGTVYQPDGQPGDVEIKAYQLNGNGHPELVGSGFVDLNTGNYSLLLPPRVSLYILADGGEWGMYPQTWLGDVGTIALALPTNALPETTLSGLDIHLLDGYNLSGSIFEEFTGNSIFEPLRF
jgi:hypothetical protein